jgi:hypothetical protein
MMYCTNCGTELVDDSKFCWKCGTKVNIPPAITDQIEGEVQPQHFTELEDEIQENEESSGLNPTWKVLFVIGILGTLYYLFTDLPGKRKSSDTNVVENHRIYGKIGDQIQVKHFSYRVNDIQYVKSFGDEFYQQTADGVYLIVDLSLVNRDNVSHTLDNNMFKLTDEKGREFQSSGEATTALLMSNKETLFLKQCNPQVQKRGLIAFEVPQKGLYDLHLSGGFWTGAIAIVRLAQQ